MLLVPSHGWLCVRLQNLCRPKCDGATLEQTAMLLFPSYGSLALREIYAGSFPKRAEEGVKGKAMAF